MSNILDWTTAALKRKADQAALTNNLVLANILDNCIDMYREGLITLTWEGGEPYMTLTDEGVSQIEKINSVMGTRFRSDDYPGQADGGEPEHDVFLEEWEDE